ncbi:MAG: hypothetical protein ACQEQL_03785 [Pseudomonadota bacterium]
MRHTYSKKHFKGLLSASAIALTLSVAPAYGQSSSANTGYSAQTTNPATTTTTSKTTRTVVGKDNTARSQNRTAYGAETTASARGGEIITRSGPAIARSRNSVTIEETRRGPQNTSRYQTQSNLRSASDANNRTARARTGTPTARQSDNLYSPERLSDIETAVGTTTTTIERTSPETKREMYRDIGNKRIDQKLKAALNQAYNDEDVTLETRSRTRLNK